MCVCVCVCVYFKFKSLAPLSRTALDLINDLLIESSEQLRTY